MSAPPPVAAFYTPLKHPFQREPSGDREIARTLMQGLHGCGFAPHLASRFRTWRRRFEPADAERIERVAAVIAQTLVRRYRRRPSTRQPRVWMTYQSYHRSPDLLGPAIATALEIPYVLVDTALSSKSRRTSFRPWASAARLAVRRADLIFMMSPRDLPSVAAFRGPRFTEDRVLLLPPAVDTTQFEASSERRAAYRAALTRRFAAADGPLLLCVAAMREVGKLDSYRLLARALLRLASETPRRLWRLVVVGDGPARSQVEAAMAPLPADRVTFLGALEPQALPPVYLGSDILALPGMFHVVYLQAAAAGLPVVACRGPEPDMMVAPGGALRTDPTPAAFAEGLARLLDDPALCHEMGTAARRFVAAERSLDAFHHRLRDGLARLKLP